MARARVRNRVKTCAAHTAQYCRRTAAHCSYLDTYISQKIRLCEGDFEGKFQTRVHASIMNFLIWKFRYTYYTHFHSIFCRSCQIHCFLHTVTAISKRLKHLSHIFASNCNLDMSSHSNSSNSVQKAVDVDLTTLAKNSIKMSIIDLNFQTKKCMILACTLVWNLPSKSPL